MSLTDYPIELKHIKTSQEENILKMEKQNYVWTHAPIA
jgi:hypothetical protein